MELKPITLQDKELVDSYLKYDTKKACDLCFANVYLWKRTYKAGFAIVENCLIFGNPDRCHSVSFPFGEEQNILKALPVIEQWFADRGLKPAYHLVSPEHFAFLEEHFPGKYQVEYERDMADYVYEAEKLATLSGKKYHGKKNHINKFIKTYPDWSYEEINDDNVEDCFQMALDWRSLNGVEEDETKRQELTVTMNALRLMKELNLTGGLLRVEGEVVAFSIGEPLNPDMYVVHIEKAFSEVPGAYTMINQQFVEHAAAGYKYVNREDDSGVEGLRKAKESYHPAFLLEKGYVTLREDD